jgi:hypothetical protein
MAQTMENHHGRKQRNARLAFAFVLSIFFSTAVILFQNSAISIIETLEAVLTFAQRFQSELREKWSWTELINFLNHSNLDVKWYCIQFPGFFLVILLLLLYL